MISNQILTSQKTVLVTGTTSGIGKVTVLELARQGYQVLITSRDAAKGQQMLQELQAQNDNTVPELFVGDLSGMADVRRIAAEVRVRHPKLDVLIDNAGGLFDKRQLTVDGFEYTFAFNHLSYFLLTSSGRCERGIFRQAEGCPRQHRRLRSGCTGAAVGVARGAALSLAGNSVKALGKSVDRRM